MLSQKQVDTYHEQGYVIPDFQLDQAIVDDIRQQHEQLLARHPQFADYCPALLAYDTGFLNYIRTEPILDMVGQLIGDDFALWNASFFAKPARKGRRVPWHQDGEYWPIRPLATCSVWLALDDATIDNGCLELIPGSHRRTELLPHHMNPSKDLALPLELDPTGYDETAAVPICLKAGQLSLHDIFMVHGSEPNLSDHPRRAMTMRFMPTTSLYDRAQAARNPRDGRLSMSERTLFLMRGVDRNGNNDFRVRY
jgi:ectoine hydroxylase-related dioxygenase (phytanoyl-CoA dioxygenase family)